MGKAARLNVAGQAKKAASLAEFRMHRDADRALIGLRLRLAHGTLNPGDERLIAQLGPACRAYVGLPASEPEGVQRSPKPPAAGSTPATGANV